MEFELNRRKALAFLMVVGVVAAGAGAGTMAYFSDTGHSNGNTISAGTLDLLTNGNNQNAQLINVSNAKPGDSGSETLTLSNNGTIDGTLNASVNVTGQENGITDPESNVDSTPNSSELKDHLQLKINGSRLNTNWRNASSYDGSSYQFGQLGGGNSTTLNVYWRIPNGTGNVIQSDSVTANATFTLDQQH